MYKLYVKYNLWKIDWIHLWAIVVFECYSQVWFFLITNKWLNGTYLDNQSFVESYNQINHIYSMYDMEFLHANNHTMKYKNTSKYPKYQTSENALCLNEDNIPSADQHIISLFQSVVLFLDEKN